MNNIMISVTVGILVLVGVLIAYEGHRDDDPAIRYVSSSKLEEHYMPGHGMDEHHEEKIYTAEPAGGLPAEVIAVLDAAIMDEYKAHAVYDAVLERIGSTRPFSRIIFAEKSHISSLEYLYDKYGVTIPEDTLLGNVGVADTKTENCQIGVEAEIANAALYHDYLLPAVSDYPDITDTFMRLMNASQYKHLLAFERCAN